MSRSTIPVRPEGQVIVTGSLAFDQIMVFPGSFKDHILPDKLHVINISFLVSEMRKQRGGCAANIAYTLALLESVPRAQHKNLKLRPIVGSPPDMARIPRGCAFHPRCRFATAQCRDAAPRPVAVVPGRTVECHHAEKVFNGG